jgi:hypothetical protein
MVWVDRSIRIESFMPSGLKMPSVCRDKLEVTSLLHSPKSWRWRLHFPTIKRGHRYTKCIWSEPRSVVRARNCENLKNYESVNWTLLTIIVQIQDNRLADGVSQWLRRQKRRSAATCGDCGFDSHREHGMFVSCECCVLLGRDICDRPILCSGDFYRVCVCVCHWVWADTTTPTL